MKKEEKTVKALEQRRQDLEDVGLKPTPTSQFITTLLSELDFDLALRIKSTPAAKEFLYSVEAGHSEALQGVRADDLLTAMHEDLHESRMTLIDVYAREKPLAEAGEFDEEDMAMHETLKRRINHMGSNLLSIADLKDQPKKAFEILKSATTSAKEAGQFLGQSKVPDWLSPG